LLRRSDNVILPPNFAPARVWSLTSPFLEAET
jgi:hypothetical protein